MYAVSLKDNGIRDPRLVRDKQFMNNAQQKIIEYLSNHGYTQILTPKTLSSPTKKDFENVFKFLYAQIDSQYSYGRKIEDDVSIILRQCLRYPFADSISKSSLHAVGSVQSWPTLLSMLFWIVELLKISESIDYDSTTFEAQDESLSSPLTLYQFYLRAHLLRQKGASDDDVNKTLIAMFDERSKSRKEGNEELKIRAVKIANEASDLARLESPAMVIEKQLIACDLHFKETLESLDNINSLTGSLNESIKNDQMTAVEYDNAIMQANIKIQQLDNMLSQQDISKTQAEQLALEKDNLLMEISNTEERVNEKVTELRDFEIMFSKQCETVRRKLAEYSSLARDANEDVLSFDPASLTASKMIANRAVVQKSIAVKRSELSLTCRQMQQNVAKANVSLQSVSDALSDEEANLLRLELEAEQLSMDTRSARSEAEMQMSDLKRAIAGFDRDIKLERDSSAKELVLWENKMHKMQIEHDRVQRECQQQVYHAAVKVQCMLDEIEALKTHVSTSLASLHSDAVAELKAANVCDNLL